MNVELIWNKGNISPTFGSQLLSCSILVQLFTNWLKDFNLWLKRKSCCPRAAFVSSESEPPTGAVANMMGHYSSSNPLFEIFTQIPPFNCNWVSGLLKATRNVEEQPSHWTCYHWTSYKSYLQYSTVNIMGPKNKLDIQSPEKGCWASGSIFEHIHIRPQNWAHQLNSPSVQHHCPGIDFSKYRESE